ncbi:MAG: type I polyketide synthase [Anaerolineales bacterium]
MTQKPEQDNEVTQLKRALLALREMRAKVESLEQARSEPVAVIGMGCRLPGGANTPAAFWKLLMDGVDAISEVPAERWSAEEIYASDFMQPGKANTRWGGFLEHVDQFDPAFFGISPREAMHMDPQQRLLLEVAYEALEDAGLALDQLEGSLTGVFAGIHSHSSDYAWMQMRDLNDIDTHTGAGTAHSIIANRISYLFNWQGPSLSVDTACSSSLVAAHLACQSLRNRESNLALVAGVNLFLTPESTITFSKLQMMATDGRCKTFDARADGFVRSEGCGVLVLKRLSDAVADSDRILAVIRGSAVNQDGRTNGLTAPNGLSQQNVIRQALANSSLTAEQMTYVETHGTGTKLGDPIEVEALAEVIGKTAAGSQPCILGAVKANIGHMEAAAGIGGLIKTVLVLRNQVIPPQLHIQQLNPLIQLAGTRFEIPTAPKSYPRAVNAPRFAGVSSFGFGGTNAHIILGEAPPTENVETSVPSAPYSLSLSARSDDALHDLAAAYQAFLSTTGSELADILFTASNHRTHHEKRLTVVGSTSTDLIERLEAFRRKDEHPDVAQGQSLASSERGLAFVFSGQGPQWLGMGRELMQAELVFRETIAEIDNLLKKHVNWSLIEELNASEENSRLAETEVAQPAIFAMQVGLAALWKSWGIEPEAVVGHSVGEIAAAQVAGVLSLEDAVRVVYHRSRLMQRVTGQGRMAAVGVGRAEAEMYLANYSGLSIGAVNSPSSTVLSGTAEALEEIVSSLTARGTFARMLPVNYAFHSPVMDSLVPELTEALKGLTPRPAIHALYSTVRGERAKDGDYDAAYWAKNIRQPVLFGPAIQTMTANGFNTFVEVSPHPVLSETISQSLDARMNALIVPSLRRNQSERGVMLRSLGALFTRGFPVKWNQLYPKGHIVDLPHYPWQHARYWLPNSQYIRYSRVEVASAARGEETNWFYDLTWQALSQTSAERDDMPGDWLILADHSGIGLATSERLRELGQSCRLVQPEEQLDEHGWLESVPNPLGILDLRALNTDDPLDDTACVNALRSAQALIDYKGTGLPKLWLITQNVQEVDREMISSTVISQSLLWGLGRTLSLEQPLIWGGLIDLDSGPLAQSAESIASQVIDADGEDQVAVRDGKRFGLRLKQIEKPSSSSMSLSAEGAYLITGGLGGLGQQLARWLVGRGAKHLVLTSRTGLPDRAEWAQVDLQSELGRRVANIQQLEALGAEVTVAAADTANETEMTALFESFGKTLPPLRGVIHAAGVVSTQALSSMSEESLRDVLKPKVAGAWLLHQLTQELKLDFFVLFSSSASVLGSANLGHYSAANHYLDTLAHIRRGLNLPAVSINWGWWAATGMATAEIEEQFKQIGQNAMPVEGALQALDVLICGEAAQRMVASIDWTRFAPIYEAKRRRPLIELIGAPAEQHQEPDLTFTEQLQAVPAALRYERLKSHIRDHVARVLGFGESDRMDPQQGFFTMGMDSVMAVQLRIRLETSLGQTLPSTIAFEYPTIEALTSYIAKDVLKLDAGVNESLVNDSDSGLKTEPSKTLSEDELLAKLDDELAAFSKIADGD